MIINIRVRDHCHITSKYEDSGHKTCNANYILTERYP